MATYDEVENLREASRVDAARKRRKELVHYNLSFKDTHVNCGEKVSVDTLRIPAMDCLVAANFGGWGDGSQHTYIVVGRGFSKKGAVVRLYVARIYGLDMGIGDADAMPQHPGMAAIDPSELPVELTIRWEKGEVRWGVYNKALKRWEPGSWTVGQYVPSMGPLDNKY